MSTLKIGGTVLCKVDVIRMSILHCTGCWAAEYGRQLNLSLETMDSIIRQGKELGVYMYIYTGGEPLVRKADLLRLCEIHPDCEFLSFTNGTLIDRDFCQELLRVKNFIPAISLEGFEEANDSRRGEGSYQKVGKAMELLREHGLPFGISTCYTSRNCSDVTSEAFFDFMIESGALRRSLENSRGSAVARLCGLRLAPLRKINPLRPDAPTCPRR